jgi:heme/copper-type cytochrome/quinol oxidase subunit 2
MNSATTRNLIFLSALVVAGATLFAPDALAQCAMCKASAANLDSVSARTLNLATLILLCPPVAIFCAIFVIAYKHRNTDGEGNGGDES